MNIRKVLLASTALIAIAGYSAEAQAQANTSTLTGAGATVTIDNGTTNANLTGDQGNNEALNIDDDSDVTVTSTGVVENTNTGADASAIDISTSGGTEDVVITINNGGTVSNDGTGGAAAIQSVAGSDLNSLTITVNGTLESTNGQAVNLNAGTDVGTPVQVNIGATGDVTGELDLVTADNAIVDVNISGGAMLEGITTGSAADTIDVTGVAATVIDGDVVTAGGNDSVTVANGQTSFTGAINLGTDGSDTFTLNSAGGTLTLVGANVVTADEIVVRNGTLDVDAGDVSNSTALTLGFTGAGGSSTVRVDDGSTVTGITVDKADGSVGIATLNVDTTGGDVAGFGAIGQGTNGALNTINVTGGNDFVVTADVTATTTNIDDTAELEIDSNNFDSNIVGSSGVNTLSVDGGSLLNGAANTALLLGGNDIVNVTGGSIDGTTLDLGAGDDAVNVSGGDIDTTNLRGGVGTDTIDVTGAAGISSAISGFEGIDISGGSTLTLDGSVAGTATLDYDTASNNVVVLNNTGATFSFGAVTGLAGDDTLTLTDGNFNATSVDLGNGGNIVNVAGGTFGTTANGITVMGGTGIDTLNVTGGTLNSAVNLGDGANQVDIDAGTVAGNIIGGAVGDTVDVDGGILNGNITLGTGIDVVTLGNTTLNGVLDTGDGETITVDAGTVNINSNPLNVSDIALDTGTTTNLNIGAANTFAGTISGGTAGAQILDLQSGTFSGGIDLDDGVDTVTINGATLSGDYTGGTGVDNFTLTTGTFSGNFIGGAGGAADVVTIAGGALGANTTFAAATGQGAVLNIDTSLTLSGNQDVDGFALDVDNNATLTVASTAGGGAGLGAGVALDAATVAANASLIANADVNVITGTYTNLGTTRIGDGVTVTIDDYADGAGANLVFTTTTDGASNSAGAIANTAAAPGDFGNTTFSFSGPVTAGLTIQDIITGVEVTTADAFAVTDSYLYDFELLGDSANTDVNVAANNTLASALTNSGNTGAATVVAGLIETNVADADLQSYLGGVASATTAAAANSALEAGLPNVEGAGYGAAIETSAQSGQIISNRLGSLRGFGSGSNQGVASGDGHSGVKAWSQVFGSTGEQDQRDGVAGYDIDSYGVSFGVDKEFGNDLTAGIAVTYAMSKVDSEDAASTETDVDTYGITLYGEHEIDDTTYVNALVGYSFSENDVSRVSPTVRSFDYDANTFSLAGEVGRSYPVSRDVNIVPHVGVSYMNYSADNFTDPGMGGVNTEFENLNRLEGIVGFDLEYTMETENGSTFMPYVSADFGYDFIGDEVESTANFVGGGAAFTTEGFESQDERLNIGAGFVLATEDQWEFSADYEYEIKADFDSHSGRLKASRRF